jgi:hypothetical protein
MEEPEKIFSGDYSRDMWDSINSAKTMAELRGALYFVCCRLQELESRLTKRVPDFGKAPAKLAKSAPRKSTVKKVGKRPAQSG